VPASDEQDEDEEEEIEDQEDPLVPEQTEPDEDDPGVIIEEPELPLTLIDRQGSWALFNLILSILGIVLAIMVGVRVLLTRKRDQEEGEEENGKDKRKRLPLIILIPLLAIIGIVIFSLTQNVRLSIAMVDWWTVAHVILFVGALLCYIFAYKRDKSETDDGKPTLNPKQRNPAH